MVVASGKRPGSPMWTECFFLSNLRAGGPGGGEACGWDWSPSLLGTQVFSGSSHSMGLQRVHQEPLVFPSSCDFPDPQGGVFARSPAIHAMSSLSFIWNGDFQTLWLSKRP